MSTMGYVTTLTGAEDAASLSLDFEKQSYRVMEGGKLVSKKFSDFLTFARNTTGGRFNEKGLYETVPANQPRFDYDPVTKVLKGLLVEEQRTNIVPYSDNMRLWNRTRVEVKQNSAISPDGKMNAAKLVSSTVADWHYTSSPSFAVPANTTYTQTVFAKAGEWPRVRLGFMDTNVFTGAVVFDLTTGTRVSGAAGEISSVGNGWYRCTLTNTSKIASNSGMSINPVKAGEVDANSAGDGVSGIYIWGSQVELGLFSTSYTAAPEIFTSRASTATYFDRNGVLKVAAVNVPRSDAYIQFNGEVVPAGLLLETSSTNLIRRTGELMTAAPWSSSGGVVETVVGLDGELTATRFTEGLGVTASKEIRQTAAVSVVSGTTYTYSVYAKPSRGASSRLRIGFGNNGVVTDLPAQAVFNLDNKSVVTINNVTTNIQSLPDGWGRYSVTVTSTITGTAPIYMTSLGGAGGVGDGVSGFIVYGPQVETGQIPTSYIKPTGTFTSRASTATYVDSFGVIQTADNNIARDQTYGYDETGKLKRAGLLVESSATNSFVDSVGFESANWGRNSISAVPSNVIAPDGVGVYRTLTSLSATGVCSLYRTSPSVSTSTTTTFSVYVKAGTTDKCQLRFYDTSNAALATFNLTTGVVESSSGPTLVGTSITPAGGGAFRISIMVNYGSRPQGGLAAYLYVNFNNPTIGDSILAWGAQLEVNPYPTSYIPTSGAATTRAADVYNSTTSTRTSDVTTSVATTRVSDVTNTSNLLPWYNTTSGTLTSKSIPGARVGGTRSIFVLDDGAQTNRIALYDTGSGGNATGRITLNGTESNPSDIASVFSQGVAIKAAAAWSVAGGFTVSAGGKNSTTSVVSAVPSVTTLRVGVAHAGGLYNGYIQSLNFYPVRLSNTQLLILTE